VTHRRGRFLRDLGAEVGGADDGVPIGERFDLWAVLGRAGAGRITGVGQPVVCVGIVARVGDVEVGHSVPAANCVAVEQRLVDDTVGRAFLCAVGVDCHDRPHPDAVIALRAESVIVGDRNFLGAGGRVRRCGDRDLRERDHALGINGPIRAEAVFTGLNHLANLLSVRILQRGDQRSGRSWLIRLCQVYAVPFREVA
jgi:hypothetical protein